MLRVWFSQTENLRRNFSCLGNAKVVRTRHMKRCKILYKEGSQELVDKADDWQRVEDQYNVYCSGQVLRVVDADFVKSIGIEDYEPIRDEVICDIHDAIEFFDPNHKSGSYRPL